MRTVVPGHIQIYDSFNLIAEAVICIDARGEIIFLNEAATLLTGFTIENSKQQIENIFAGCQFEDPPTGTVKELPHEYSFRTGKKSKPVIAGIHTPIHKCLWVKINAQPLETDPAGEVLKTILTFKPHILFDDAAHLQVADAVHDVLDNVEEAYLILNRSGIIEYFNESANLFTEQYLTKTLQKGASLYDYALPDIHPKLPQVFKKVLAGNKIRLKRFYYDKEGNRSVYYIKLSLLSHQDKAEGIIVNLHDITEEHNLHQRLAATNERLQLAIKASKDIVWEGFQLSDGKVQLILPREFTDLTEYKPHEVPTVEILLQKVIHPADNKIFEQAFSEAEEVKALSVHVPVHRFITLTGAIRYVTMDCIVFRNEEGEPKRLVGVIKDVTNNQLLQMQLTKSSNRYEMAAEASFDSIWELDMKTELLYFNPKSLQRIFGFNLESPIPFDEYLKLTRHPEEQNVVETYKQSIASMQGDLKEYPVHKIRKADGSTGYVNVKIITLRNAEGQIETVYGTTRDITEKHMAEQEIKKSNERFQLAARASFDILWDVDMATRMVSFSTVITNLYGHEVNNPISDTEFIRLLVHPDDQEELLRDTHDFIISKDTQREFKVHRILKKDGSIAFIMLRMLAIRKPDNYVTRLIGVSRDITQHYLSEQEIRKSNERYELVSRVSLDMMWEIDFINGVYTFNDGLSRIYGYDNKEVWPIDRTHELLLHPEDRDKINKLLNARHKVKIKDFNLPVHRYVKHNGNTAFVQVHGITLYDEEGYPVRAVGVSRDITAMKELQEKMAEEEMIHLQRITEVTIETQEREREELGRELHDNINQILASVKLNLEMAIGQQSTREVALLKSYTNLQEAIREIRILSRALISPVLDIGIVDAIRQLIDNVQHPESARFTFYPGRDDYAGMNKSVQLMLYRVVQEQINNILKHSKATEVTIHQSIADNYFFLSICDNGIGFDVNEKTFGVGLRNIKSRVALYHGTVILTSKPGDGCTLDVCLPLL